MPAIYPPDTNVFLLRNVPLNPAQTYTITWEDRAKQTNWFTQQSKYKLVEFSYQREAGAIRVPGKKDIFTDVNYLMYQNSSFGDKWFYAFVTHTEYKNGDVTWIYFEIDYLQTYWFQFHWVPTFIEREHVNDDTVGLHTLPEPVEIGQMMYESIYSKNFTNWDVIVATTSDIGGAGYQGGGMYDYSFSGVHLWGFINSTDDIGRLNQFLEDISKAGKLDSISDIYVIPDDFIEIDKTDHSVLPNSTMVNAAVTKDYKLGYAAKNNKVYTFPYCFLYACNNNGQDIYYKWEFFSDVNPHFWGWSTLNSGGCATFSPRNYCGAVINYPESIATPTFPTAAFPVNTYTNYLAQSRLERSLAMASGALNTVTSLASGNIAGALNAEIGMGSTLNQMYQQSLTPVGVKGALSGATQLIAQRMFGIDFYAAHVNKEHARLIDDYFSAYGYRQDKIKVPNVWGRPYWNYVKTKDCIVYADAPVEAANQLKSSMDRGITFWHTTDVGNYDLDNSTNQPIPAPTPDPDPTPDPKPPPITPTDNAADIAMYYEGSVEWDGNVKTFLIWFYGREIRVPWCAIFASFILYKCKVLNQAGGKQASCTNWMNVLKGIGNWRYKEEYTPKRGDLVFFSNDGDRNSLDHTGIVTKVDSATVTYISGNTSNPNGGPDGVFVKSRLISSQYLIGYGVINYD